MSPGDPDRTARNRFHILNLVRLSGTLLMLGGMAVLAYRWIEPAEIVGIAIFAAGLIEALIVPKILTRAWRTPPAP